MHKNKVRNISVANVNNILVTDTLPIALAYINNSLTATGGSYSYSSGVISWTGTMSANSVVTIAFGATLSPTVPFGISIINSAVISGGGEIITRTATLDIKTQVYLPVVLKN